MTQGTIVWLRQDLRLEDNPALREAVKRQQPVVPVYIHAPQEEGSWAPGAACRYWLHQALEDLRAQLEERDSRLALFQGDPAESLLEAAKISGADAVFWNKRYEPEAVKQEKEVERKLREEGLEVRRFKANLLFEPEEVKNQQGKPYQVFTPFWKQCLTMGQPFEPLSAPGEIPRPSKMPRGLELEQLKLEPGIDWAAGIRKAWDFSQAGAKKDLQRFLNDALDDYPEQRNFPGMEGVSRLSPRLHFGQISPRQIYHAVYRREQNQGRKKPSKASISFIRQLYWREFAHHLLGHFPHTTDQPLREKFNNFPWRYDEDQLHAWQKGLTGYPMVDAGMRQLWITGWMHNRVRMVVASFLIKDLLIHWLEGARWFWDTLVDADLANNTLGWQWTAGCGADAAPYFRVFNPVSQGNRYDPKGTYVRRWIPEIARLPDSDIHSPWEAAPEVLKEAGVELGNNYPEPIVSHSKARIRALQALDETKKA